MIGRPRFDPQHPQETMIRAVQELADGGLTEDQIRVQFVIGLITVFPSARKRALEAHDAWSDEPLAERRLEHREGGQQ